MSLLAPGLFVVLAAVAPVLLRDAYWHGLLVLTAIYAIAGLSLDYIMGQMGQFSFGHAAFWGFGAYVSAKLALSLGMTPWIGFAAAALLTGALGLVVGYVALRRTRGLELAIVTLGFGVLAWLIALRWRSVTGGPAGLLGVPPPSLFGLELRGEFEYYYLALGFLLLVLFVLSRLRYSRFGRAVRSIHEHEPLASSVGISPTRHYVFAFGFATSLVGISGALYAHHFRFVTPGLLSLTPMLTFLIIVVLGGTGTLWGPVLGSVIFVWVSEFLRVGEELRFLIFGVILFLIIVFMPQGVYPAVVSAVTWFRTRVSALRRSRAERSGAESGGKAPHETVMR